MHQAQRCLGGLLGYQALASLLQATLLQALQDGCQALGTLDLTLWAEGTGGSSQSPSLLPPLSPPRPNHTYSSQSSLAVVMSSWYTSAVPMAWLWSPHSGGSAPPPSQPDQPKGCAGCQAGTESPARWAPWGAQQGPQGGFRLPPTRPARSRPAVPAPSFSRLRPAASRLLDALAASPPPAARRRWQTAGPVPKRREGGRQAWG